MSTDPNMERAARFAADIAATALPEHILDEAKKCLVDWIAVSLAARGAPEARGMLEVAKSWNSQGPAPILGAGMSAAAPVAALVNGTMSHCLDYDDTHIPTAIHVSGPTWAAVLAAGSERNADPLVLLNAFVAGFEISARLGANGIGVGLNNGGWHATSVLGRLGAAAAVAAVHGLDARQAAHALGLAATQAGGLTASFGTMAKPFHLGKTAMDAILSVQMAAQGFTGAQDVLARPERFLSPLLHRDSPGFDIAPFGEIWEIERNSFKPYAACQLTHAAIDAAHALRADIGTEDIRGIRATVHPLALKIAGIADPRTPTQGKFSLGYCIALGLQGYRAIPADFDDAMLGDPALRKLTACVTIETRDDIERTATMLEATLSSGRTAAATIDHAFGSIGNPMKWRDLDDKFMALVEPLIGAGAEPLLQALHRFERQDSVGKLLARCVVRDVNR